MKYLTEKYYKPKSLTWLASFAMVAAGVLIASEPLHGLTDLVQTLNGMTGGTPPAMLINAGLVGIGLRGAV